MRGLCTAARAMRGMISFLIPCLGIVCLFASISCESQQSLEDPLGDDEIRAVSLLRLIATPEEFDGSRVFVQGYLVRARESDRIYLHEVDANYLLDDNSIWLNFDGSPFAESPINNCYVIVEGTFSLDARPWTSRSENAIRGITRVRPSITRRNTRVANDCSE